MAAAHPFVEPDRVEVCFPFQAACTGGCGTGSCIQEQRLPEPATHVQRVDPEILEPRGLAALLERRPPGDDTVGLEHPPFATLDCDARKVARCGPAPHPLEVAPP